MYKNYTRYVISCVITVILFSMEFCKEIVNIPTEVPPAGETLQSITIENASRVIVGNDVQLLARGNYSNGQSVDITTNVTWTSTANNIATISSGGLITAVSPGSVTIQAESSGTIGYVDIFVDPASLTSISVTATSNSAMMIGLTRQLTATGNYDNGQSVDISGSVTWSSSATGVAIVTSTGLVTASSAGTTTITATMGTISGSLIITVNPPAVTLSSINVSSTGNSTILSGLTNQLTANGSYSNGTTLDITNSVSWSSSATNIATVNSAGLVTAISAGSATVTATSGGVSGTIVITVSAATLQSISVSPGLPAIVVLLTQQLTANGSYDNGQTTNINGIVTWTSSNTSVATVNSSGLVTGISAGTATITATSGTVSGSTTVTINAPTLTSITITPSAPSVVVGLTQQMTATGNYDNATTADLTAIAIWTSSNTAKATVNASGLVTGVGAGTASITATYGTISASKTVTINAVALSSISVTPSLPSVVVLLTQQMTATGIYNDTSTANLTASVTWTSSNTSVATVDASGLVTGISAGTVTITATSGAISGSTSVTINAATLTSIAVTPVNPSVIVLLTQQMTATGTYNNASTANITATVTWTSSDTAIATVNSAGIVTCFGGGTATITATSGAISGSTTVTIIPPSLVSIAVTPVNPFVISGQTQQMTATGTFNNATTPDLTSMATWTSSNNGIATVSASGVVTAVSAGTVTITATSGAISGSTNVTVPVALTLAAWQASSVVAGGYSYFSITGLAGGNYLTHVSGMSGDVDLYVYSDSNYTTLLCSSVRVSTLDDSCSSLSGTSLYIKIRDWAGGATFQVRVDPVNYIASLNITYASNSIGASNRVLYKTPATSVSGHYSSLISAATANMAVVVYSDSGFQNVLCSANAFIGTSNERCNFTGFVYYYIAVYNQDAAAASYSVIVGGPYTMTNVGSLATPFALTASTTVGLTVWGQFGVGASGTSYYDSGATALSATNKYTVSVWGMSASTQLYVYTDAAFSTLATVDVTSQDPNPDTTTTIAGNYKNITVAAGPTKLYFKVLDGGTVGSLYNIGITKN